MKMAPCPLAWAVRSASARCARHAERRRRGFSYVKPGIKEEFTARLGTRLPGKGPTTGTIIGGIIGAIVLLAVIGTAIALYRKRRNGKLNGDGPPKYKPPPPKKKKNGSSANKELSGTVAAVPEDRLLNAEQHSTQSAEPVTDLDAYTDEESYGGERAHYYAAAPSGWDDPANSEVPPPYRHTGADHQDFHQGPAVNRGDSFVSPAMFV